MEYKPVELSALPPAGTTLFLDFPSALVSLPNNPPGRAHLHEFFSTFDTFLSSFSYRDNPFVSIHS
jgi:hypothetical protein